MKNKTMWDNDSVQFARLLGEIVAALPCDQVKRLIKDLSASMDLSVDQVNELFDRADALWVGAKGCMDQLNMMEELLSITKQFKEQMVSVQRDRWSEISARTADLRDNV